MTNSGVAVAVAGVAEEEVGPVVAEPEEVGPVVAEPLPAEVARSVSDYFLT